MAQARHFCGCCVERKRGKIRHVRYWEIIADNFSKSRLELGLRLQRLYSRGRAIWVADVNRDENRRFIVRADEKLTAFVELDSTIL